MWMSSDWEKQKCTGQEDTGTAESFGQETNLRQQVKALTKTLTSLNETNNTLESRFQTDKKELLEQIESLKVRRRIVC